MPHIFMKGQHKMAEYFPIFRRAADTTILIIGNNSTAGEKLKKLSAYPFNIFLHAQKADDPQTLLENTSPDIVILADKALCDAEKLFELCSSRHIELNTVDDIKNSTFIFPSLISAEPLSVAISTDGKCPAASVKVRTIIEEALPDKTDDIIKQLSALREKLDASCRSQLMKKLCDAAFEKGYPLTQDEILSIVQPEAFKD